MMKTSVLILLIFIINIEHIYSQDDIDQKNKVAGVQDVLHHDLINKSSNIPCDDIYAPVLHLRMVLQELESKHQLYCPSNTPPETFGSESTVDPRINQEEENNDEQNEEYNHPLPLGQRTFNYPLIYNQPWTNYPSNYIYQYGRQSYRNPNYYYVTPLPYVQVYHPNSPLQPQSQPFHPIIDENLDNYVTQEPTFERSTSSVLTQHNLKKHKQRCSKRRKSRRMKKHQRKDEKNKDINLTENNNNTVNNDTVGQDYSVESLK